MRLAQAACSPCPHLAPWGIAFLFPSSLVFQILNCNVYLSTPPTYQVQRRTKTTDILLHTCMCYLHIWSDKVNPLTYYFIHVHVMCTIRHIPWGLISWTWYVMLALFTVEISQTGLPPSSCFSSVSTSGVAVAVSAMRGTPLNCLSSLLRNP